MYLAYPLRLISEVKPRKPLHYLMDYAAFPSSCQSIIMSNQELVGQSVT